MSFFANRFGKALGEITGFFRGSSPSEYQGNVRFVTEDHGSSLRERASIMAKHTMNTWGLDGHEQDIREFIEKLYLEAMQKDLLVLVEQDPKYCAMVGP